MKKLLLYIIMGIVLISSVSAGTWDDSVSYDSEKKEYRIVNVFGLGSEIGKIRLNTPQVYQVGAGYQKVAEITINNGNNEWEEIMGGVELYQITKDKGNYVYAEFDRNIDYKYKTLVDEDIYSLECSMETLGNGTAIRKCIQVKIGTKKVEGWIDFSNSVVGKETITIGLFTNVKEGDYVEWIPNIYGHNLDKWAVWSQELNAGLIAYYKLDETTGTIVNDSTPSNYGGNCTNCEGDEWTTGKINNGIKLNLTLDNTEYINVSDNGDFDTTKSLSLWWYNGDATGGPGTKTLIAKNPTDCIYSGISYEDNTKTLAGYSNNESGSVYFRTGALGNDQWYHLVYVMDDKNRSLYIDGVLNVSGNDSSSTPWDNSKEVDMGGCNNSRTIIGLIDEVGIWNRTLSSSEISTLYNGGDGVSYVSFFIDLASPTDNSILLNQTVDFGCFVYGSTTLVNVSLYVDGVKNQTNTSGINNTFYNFTTTIGLGSHNWTCETIDNADAISKADEFDFSINSFTTNSETYSNTTTEGNIESFVINLTTATGYQISSANLAYNGTDYAGTLDNSDAPIYIITRNLIIPDVSADTNVTFFWNITLQNGANDASTSHNQTIYALSIDDCTANSNPIYNFTLKDEEIQNIINGTNQSSNIDVEINVYSYDRDSLILNLSANYSKIYFAEVCINDDLSGGERYSVDGIIKYSGVDYATEYYHIQNFSLSNTTLAQNITLYDLLTADNQPFKILYKNTRYLAVADALITIQRKYVEEGVFKAVEIPKTDSSGETIGNLVVNDVIYTFIVSKYGVTLGTFSNMRVICQTPTISECKINLNSFSSSVPVTNFTLESNFYYTLAHNRTTRTTTVEFSVLNGTPVTVVLNVTKEDALGTSVCSETITTSTGTLTCIAPVNIGNGTIMAKVYRDGELMGQGHISLEQLPSNIYGGIVVFLAIFLMVTLLGAGISDNPIYTVIFFMIGVIILFALNLVAHHGFIGPTAAILWLIIAIILLIIKGGKR